MKKRNSISFIRLYYCFLFFFIAFSVLGQTVSSPFFLDTKVPVVTLISPNSGNYALGQTISVTWTATDDNIAVNGVCIGLWDNDMEHFFVLEDNLSNDGSEQIELTIPSNNAKIKVVVRDEFGNPGSDMSDQLITVSGGNVLNGYVLEYGNNDPINNASVTASYQRFEFSAQTNSDGYFSISNLPSGNYAITALKDGYESETSYKTINGNYTINFHLVPSGGGGSNEIVINNKLTISADNIQQTTSNKYQLSGNVNINGILYFDGTITLDKRSHLVYPEISGSCPYSVHGIQGNDHTIKSGNSSFHYYCHDEKLIAKGYSVMNYLTTLVGGFTVKSGILEVDDDGEYVEAMFIAQMPYPVDKIIKYLEDKYNEDIPTLFDELGGSIIYHKTSGIGISANVSGIDCKFGLFDIEDFHLNFNTTEQIYGGGLKLKIPGSVPGTDSNSDSTHQNQIPVKVISEEGDTTQYPNLEEFVMMQRALGLKFLSLGFDIEFVQGGLNSLMLYLGTKIAIDATGLFITEISGGVTDLQSKEWKIHAYVDISLGLELPVVGTPLKIDDLGVAIQPINYFKGSGALEVFGWEAAGAFIEYDHKKRALDLESNINLFNILQGRNYFNLRYKDFNGGGTCALTTPELERPFRFLSNLKLGYTEVLFSNYDIRSTFAFGKLSFAQRMEFGKEGFPWFHYYLGKNYNKMHQIWKGNSLDGRDMIDFIVQENAQQLLVVSEGTTDIIDYYLEDPMGVIYDSTNSYYEHFPEVNETVMNVYQPIEGTWTFVTTDTIQYQMEAMCNNQSPTVLMDQPANRRTRSNQITFAFTDYSDTLNVKIYYDTDAKNYDGTFIQDLQVVNNANPSFDWQNDTIPNGEYFIYTLIDDGYNTPVAQYAPGSILIQNDTLTEIAQNIQLTQVGDSLLISWDDPVQPYTYATVINYQRPTDKLSQQKVMADSSSCYITGLEMGKKYDIWCQFLNLLMDKGPESDTVSIVLSTGLRNNPPYFQMDPDSTWIFIEGVSSEYVLDADDADQDALTYGIVEDTLGMILNDDTLSWTPSAAQTGVFDIQFTVTDGTTFDTIHQYMIVYNHQQMHIDLAFSSVNLYESDNMFIKLKNYHELSPTVNITLANLNTSEQTQISCRKINNFDFIGQFELSFANRTNITVNNGDTLQASYFYIDSLYTATSYYDSLPQPTDVTPPAQINDLEIIDLGNNEITLKWTATGDDQNDGKAYRYDIRYHFDSIATENDYLVSHLYPLFHPPEAAGESDSVIIDLAALDSAHLFNRIWWAIVAEDEMYNRSNIGTTGGHSYHLMPYNLETEIINVNTIKLDWDGPMPGNSRDTIAFNGYDLFRRKNQEEFIKISSLLDNTIFTDVVFDNQNALYTYGIQSKYSGGENSDTLYSEQIELGLYTPLNVFINCMDSLNNNGVNYSMSSIDSLYPQNYQRVTSESGLILFSSVVKGDYSVTISKGFYASIIDTVTISGQNNQLAFELWPVIVLSKDSMLFIANTNSIVNRSFNIHNYSSSVIDYAVIVNVEDTSQTRTDSLYTWIDSDQTNGPEFFWYDITGIGTLTSLTGDDNFIELTLPFTFDFYEDPKTSVKVSTNGYLTFGSDGSNYSNDPIPNTTDPNDIIAPFWDDQHDRGGHVYVYYDTLNTRFIIQYTDWGYFNNSGFSDFQVQLYQNGRIDFYYLSMTGTLSSATVGIENADATEGLQIAYNEPYIHDSLAITINPVSTWIKVLNPFGSVAANAEDTIWVQVNTHDLLSGEDYLAEIVLSFNDTISPQRTVPVLLKTITQQVLTIPEGWGGISGYIDPVDKDVTHIFSAVEEQLVILQTSNLVYWPSQGINTIGDWNYLSGYKIKTMSDIQVALVGPMGQSRTLLLNNGWTLIPVLSSSPVNTQQMFSPLGDTLIIIKEVAGVGIYWPSQGVNSLELLYPGKAYYLCTTHSCQITFPENQRHYNNIIAPVSIFSSTDVWNPVVPSHSSHIIGIDVQALNKLKEGDYIGVFNSEGRCCGITRIESKNKPIGFPVFSDDISTEIVDGLFEGEAMEFRLYRPSTGEQYNLEPVFDMQQPHAGNFAANGLSYILGFDATWTISDFSSSSMHIDIYPIPANNELIIDIKHFVEDDYQLNIYNSSGQLVFNSILTESNTKINISSLKAGAFALCIKGDHTIFMKKIVVK